MKHHKMKQFLLLLRSRGIELLACVAHNGDYSKMLQTCPFNLQDVAQTQDALTPTISFSQSNDTLRRYNLQMIQASLSEFSRLRAHTSSTLREIQNATHTKRTHLFNSNCQSFTAQEEEVADSQLGPSPNSA